MAESLPPQDTVDVSALPDARALARLGSTEVLLVTTGSPEAERRLAAEVALRAMKDTPFHVPAYVATDQGDTRVFIARAAGRAVGLAVLRPRPRWAWWSWDDWDAERRPSTAVAPMTSWTVETIWTHATAQGHGLARQILEVAAREVEQPISSFGWHRPFTPSGEACVRRWCPEGIWVPD